ncbi:hypothetical protein ACTXG7_14225 [Mycolicibacterium sp. Dal123E01]|uniref:hypothetical protein n=1 Tax=Mycolicibacterium sp. Dal123E01 TaxID=3457578 RepID=UPI00403EB6F0
MPTAGAAPPDPGVLAQAPVLTLTALGSSPNLSFYGQQAQQSVTLPVQQGLVPAALTATVWAPPGVQQAVLTMTQEDRIISRVDLPVGPPAPVSIPLAGAQVVDNAVALTLTVNVVPLQGYCLDPTNPLRLTDAAIRFDGRERPPATVADFLPPVLRKLTVFVSQAPTLAESDTAVQLADAVVAHYGQQFPDVGLVTLPPGQTIPAVPPAPLERQVVVKEGLTKGLSLQPGAGMPSLLISGSGAELGNQARLLSSDLSQLALTSGAAVGPLKSAPVLPGDRTTLREIGGFGANSASLAPRVDVGVDQTRFGRSIHSVRLHLKGSYTSLPTTMGGQVVVMIGKTVIDKWAPDAAGVIDRWVDIPDKVLQRYTTITVEIDITGNTGRCGEFQPLTLTIDDDTGIDSRQANPPVPAGFQSLPQGLMPHVQIGIGNDQFADTARAVTIITGLQRVSAMPIETTVVTMSDALAGSMPAIIIAANGWDHPDITLPVSGSSDQVQTIAGVDNDGNGATLTLTPGYRFGSLQTVVDGNRSLLVATSTGVPGQLDGLLNWLNSDVKRWTRMDGIAVIAPPDRAPVIVAAPKNQAAPAATVEHSDRTWWYAAAAIGAAAVVVAAAVIFLRARRQ